MAIIAVHKDGSILRVIRDELEVESTKTMLSQLGYQLFVVHKTTELSTNWVQPNELVLAG